MIQCIVLATTTAHSQEIHNQATIDINKDFPILAKRLGTQSPANFVVAIDRSGSMKKLWPAVQRGVISFLEAIPDGDYFSIIAFGTGASQMVTPRPINSKTRGELIDEIGHLGEPTDSSTDIGAALEKVLDELNVSTGNRLKFVFLFTDFAHEPPQQSKYFGKMSPRDDVWQRLAERRRNEQVDSALQVFALLLPASNLIGRDLQLGKAVFPELQSVQVNEATLLPWFERRKAEIARDKLLMIARRDSELPPITLKSIQQRGEKLVATFDLAPNRIVDTAGIQGIEIRDVSGVALRQDVKLDSPGNLRFKFDGSSPPQIEIPIGDVERQWSIIRWSKESDISLTVAGTQDLMPEAELRKLDLPTTVSFKLPIKDLPLAIHGGLLSPLLAGLLIIALLALAWAVWRYFRKEYIIGEITIPKVDRVEKVIAAQKQQVFEIGNIGESERGVQIPRARWRIRIEAFNPPQRGRGVYVTVYDGSAILRRTDGEIALTGMNWERLPSGSEVKIQDYVIKFS